MVRKRFSDEGVLKLLRQIEFKLSARGGGHSQANFQYSE